MHALAVGAAEHAVALGGELDIARLQAAVLEVEHRGMVRRNVADYMVHAELVQLLAQLCRGDADSARNRFFVNGLREGEDAGVHAHEGFQEGGHHRVRKLHVVQLLPVHFNAHAGGNIHVFRKRPVAFPLNVFDGVVGRCPLQFVLLAKSREVKLEHAADAGFVRYLKEDVHLLVNVLDVFQGGEGDLLQLFQAALVRAVPQEDGVGGKAVAAGAPRFLEIGLRAFRQVCVHHKADIGLVDTHAKGVGAHHDARFAAFPVFLPEGAGFRPQSGVVEGGRDAGGPQGFRQFLGACPAADIHDAGARNAFADAQDLSNLVLRLPHYIAQVGALEAGPQEILFLEAQAVHDVVAHYGRCRGGEGDDRGVYTVSEFANLQVVGTEVVAPLGDAVGFVHHNVGDFEHAQIGLEQVCVQAFRAQQGQVHFPAVHAGMDGHGPYAPLPEVLHLVFHEGNQGRDYQRQALLHEGGYLEAHALAAARGQNGQHVPSFQGFPDNLLLHGPETVIAPICLQYLLRRHSLRIYEKRSKFAEILEVCTTFANDWKYHRPMRCT